MTREELIKDLSEQKFDSFDDWVNTATRKLATHERNGKWQLVARTPDEEDRAICFDIKARRCLIGKHFMRARDDGSFPIRYVWPDQIKYLVDIAMAPVAKSDEPVLFEEELDDFTG